MRKALRRRPAGKETSDHRTHTKLSRNEIARPRRYARRYKEIHFQEIATALEKHVAFIKQQAQCFEAAGRWYWLDERTPTRIRPTELQRKLRKIRDTAARLLVHLGVETPEDAADGPGWPEVFDALMAACPDASEGLIAGDTEKIAWLLQVFEATGAAVELRWRAHQAADDVIEIGRLTVPKGYQGDRKLNYWTLWMLAIYKRLTLVNPRLPLARQDAAKLYRFLEAAGRPLGIKRSRERWKEHVRSVVCWPTDKNNDSPGSTYKLTAPPKKRHGQAT